VQPISLCGLVIRQCSTLSRHLVPNHFQTLCCSALLPTDNVCRCQCNFCRKRGILSDIAAMVEGKPAYAEEVGQSGLMESRAVHHIEAAVAGKKPGLTKCSHVKHTSLHTASAFRQKGQASLPYLIGWILALVRGLRCCHTPSFYCCCNTGSCSAEMCCVKPK
jgi:hypothetical protein